MSKKVFTTRSFDLVNKTSNRIFVPQPTIHFLRFPMHENPRVCVSVPLFVPRSRPHGRRDSSKTQRECCSGGGKGSQLQFQGVGDQGAQIAQDFTKLKLPRTWWGQTQVLESRIPPGPHKLKVFPELHPRVGFRKIKLRGNFHLTEMDIHFFDILVLKVAIFGIFRNGCYQGLCNLGRSSVEFENWQLHQTTRTHKCL